MSKDEPPLCVTRGVRSTTQSPIATNATRIAINSTSPKKSAKHLDQTYRIQSNQLRKKTKVYNLI